MRILYLVYCLAVCGIVTNVNYQHSKDPAYHRSWGTSGVRGIGYIGGGGHK